MLKQETVPCHSHSFRQRPAITRLYLAHPFSRLKSRSSADTRAKAILRSLTSDVRLFGYVASPTSVHASIFCRRVLPPNSRVHQKPTQSTVVLQTLLRQARLFVVAFRFSPNSRHSIFQRRPMPCLSQCCWRCLFFLCPFPGKI